MKSDVISFKNAPVILSRATVVGKKEFEGPIGSLFDRHDDTDTFGKNTWEQSESEMQRLALELSIQKANLKNTDIGAVFAGDLINQCTGSAYGLISFGIPYFGLYGACSTAAEGLILASLALNAGAFDRVAVVTSSHNCSAERQFRYPIEYGGQRTPTAQWTVTGSAAFLLGSDRGAAYITEALPGRSIDLGIDDAANMGAAMAPAAVDTLTRYFKATGKKPSDFDMIVTGDLGYEGHAIVLDLMKKQGIDLSSNYTDCGLLIYDRKKQDMHAGGSGCACSAAVLAALLLDRFERGELHDILWMGTGALMSPMSVQQGLSIPGICHLVRITKERML